MCYIVSLSIEILFYFLSFLLLPPKLSGLKHVFVIWQFHGFESKHDLAGSSALGTVTRLLSRYQLEPGSSHGWAVLVSRLTQLLLTGFSAGCWTEGFSSLLTIDQRPSLPSSLPSVSLHQSKQTRGQREREC